MPWILQQFCAGDEEDSDEEEEEEAQAKPAAAGMKDGLPPWKFATYKIHVIFPWEKQVLVLVRCSP